MSNSPDVVDRETAEKLSELLLAACEHMNRAAATLSSANSSPAAATIKRGIAEAMATIGRDVLECNIYSNYADLRPYDPPMPSK